eukprot:TRINITY_DN6664_c0_g1_i2.p1 TRINITY_DN6664_c0_g1~~TRINITY_DN6664_c0_g1_i2.p1  ORF type:complete len:739 (+),score=127.97 TRINITY_DN6664_c0_g1_i2:187-2217(+)
MDSHTSGASRESSSAVQKDSPIESVCEDSHRRIVKCIISSSERMRSIREEDAKARSNPGSPASEPPKRKEQNERVHESTESVDVKVLKAFGKMSGLDDSEPSRFGAIIDLRTSGASRKSSSAAQKDHQTSSSWLSQLLGTGGAGSEQPRPGMSEDTHRRIVKGILASSDHFSSIREDDAKSRSNPSSPSGQDVGEKMPKVFSRMPKRMAVENMDANIYNSYQVKREVAKGTYSVVMRAAHKCSGMDRAIKSIPWKRGVTTTRKERLEVEVNVMQQLDHPGIVKLYETFQDEKHFHLVMELCTGGELFDRITEAGHFSETQASVLLKQMMSSVYYMHKNGISHRNLRPENFLFQDKAPIEHSDLKLIDFGLASEFEEGRPMRDKDKQLIQNAGTPYYVAPEVLSKCFDERCDCWSIGCIMYIMLCGYPPFDGDNDEEVLLKVRRGTLSFRSLDWNEVSDDAKDLITSLLSYSSHERYSAEEAYSHVWIQEKAPNAKLGALKGPLMTNLTKFHQTNKFKKAAAQVIASQQSGDRIKDLRNLFVRLDEKSADTGSGTLNLNELREGLKSCGLTPLPKDLEQILDDLESDTWGGIDYPEFTQATLNAAQYRSEDVLYNAFCLFDKDKDGRISQQELRLGLEGPDAVEGLPKHVVDEIMKEVAAEGRNEIDFNEFLHMIRT